MEQFLRNAIPRDARTQGFTALVNTYLGLHTTWRDADLLRKIATLRNPIVHGKTEPYGYLAVPTPEIVRNLHLCLERLINPARAIPTFQRAVEAISVQDSLAKVLGIVEERRTGLFTISRL